MFLSFSRKILFSFVLIGFAYDVSAQNEFSLEKLLSTKGAAFDTILQNKGKYRLQIIYTKVDRDKKGHPTLTTYNYQPFNSYNYCASLIKFPEAVFALEKLNQLSEFKISKYDSLAVDSIFCGEMSYNTFFQNTKKVSIAQCIKEMFLVSNNHAFNPVYDFLGQQYFNKRLHDLGYRNAVAAGRFSDCDTSENRTTHPISFYANDGKLKYAQPSSINSYVPQYLGSLNTRVGKAYLGSGMLINKPKDFALMHYLSLSDAHDLLTKIIFPVTQLPSNKLLLTDDDYSFLHKMMGMFPRESSAPVFPEEKYPDNYMKYFIGLDSGQFHMPNNLRVFNKVGQAYGFMSDCSYVQDSLNKVEFFLSCSMYLNNDEILNDGKYEYETVGLPFFQNLFNAIYEYEILRERKVKPVFDKIDFTDEEEVIQEKTHLVISNHDNFQSIDNKLSNLFLKVQDQFKKPTNESPSVETIFKENLLFALSLSSPSKYSFPELQNKGIYYLSSKASNFRVFSWFSPEQKGIQSLMQIINPNGVTYVRPLNQWYKNTAFSSMVFKNIYKINSPSFEIFLIVGNVQENSETKTYIQSYGLLDDQIEKLKLFKMGTELFSDIVVEFPDAVKLITYDEIKNELSFPIEITQKRKKVASKMNLHFNGSYFEQKQ